MTVLNDAIEAALDGEAFDEEEDEDEETEQDEKNP